MGADFKSKKAAMVGYTFYDFDGRIKRHVAALHREGFEVDVIALANPLGPRENRDERVNYLLPMTRRFDGRGRVRILLEYLKFTLLTMLILVWNHFVKGRYSLVHINNMPNLLVFAAFPLKLVGVPVILDMHDTMPEIYEERFGVDPQHWIIRALMFEEWLGIKAADFVLAATHTELERVLQNGLRAEKSAVILNLPDPELFPKLPLPEEHSEEQRSFRLVYHGTLANRLGMDIALQAMTKVKESNPRVRFSILGGGEQRAELLALCDELALEDVVDFSEGAIPIEELASWLAGADLAVLPSRRNAATELMLPVKLLEYVRLGIPCVTVTTKTILYYLDESMLALVPPEDPSALADKILMLLEHPEKRITLARRARKLFDDYSFESEQRRYRDVVRGLVS